MTEGVANPRFSYLQFGSDQNSKTRNFHQKCLQSTKH